jgi:hypothetical protein
MCTCPYKARDADTAETGIIYYICYIKCMHVASTGALDDHRMPPEPVFLNVYGAQKSIPRNEFRQPFVVWRAGTIALFLLSS